MPQTLLQSQSIFLTAPDGAKLHLKRIFSSRDKPAVLCIHGAFDSGRIFYNKKLDRGLAPFLAKDFDVFVLDFRGHGESTPPVERNSTFGMYENIREDLPLAIARIFEEKKQSPVSVVAHSDGGVLFYSSFAFKDGFSGKVPRAVLVGSKRCISARNIRRFFAIDIAWYLVTPQLLRLFNFLPAKRLKIGSNNDTRAYTEQRMPWLKGASWSDPVDSFNYKEALENTNKPRTLFIAASNDPYLGNRKDVQSFKGEIANSEDEFLLASRETGFSQDYSHVSVLTDKRAESEVFPRIKNWLRG